MDAIPFYPVAYARTPFGPGDRIPAQGAPARIEILPAFADALLGIETASHLHVFSFFHRADRDALQVRPRKLMAQPDAMVPADVPLRGVFAVRSPARPNALGMTTTRLLGREGLVLHVDRLDAQDGTPIVDLKPYVPGWDLVLWGTHHARTKLWELGDEELLSRLRREAANALKEPSAHSEAVVMALLELIHQGVDPRTDAVCFAVGGPDARVDLLAVMAGATFGNGRLRFDPTIQEGVRTLSTL